MDRNVKLCILWCIVIIVIVTGAWALMTQRVTIGGTHKQLTPSSSGGAN